MRLNILKLIITIISICASSYVLELAPESIAISLRSIRYP